MLLFDNFFQRIRQQEAFTAKDDPPPFVPLSVRAGSQQAVLATPQMAGFDRQRFEEEIDRLCVPRSEEHPDASRRRPVAISLPPKVSVALHLHSLRVGIQHAS